MPTDRFGRSARMSRRAAVYFVVGLGLLAVAVLAALIAQRAVYLYALSAGFVFVVVFGFAWLRFPAFGLGWPSKATLDALRESATLPPRGTSSGKVSPVPYELLLAAVPCLVVVAVHYL
jgi:hypothetical protein